MAKPILSKRMPAPVMWGNNTMARLGNAQGPSLHHIINRLGAAYFGVSLELVDCDVEDERQSTNEGVIVPLHLDEQGWPYHYFSGPQGVQRYYLSDEEMSKMGLSIRVHEKERLGLYEHYLWNMPSKAQNKARAASS